MIANDRRERLLAHRSARDPLTHETPEAKTASMSKIWNR